MTPNEFQSALAAQHLKISQQQLAQFDTYYHQLVTVNKHVNLTRITDEGEVYAKHFYDSITGALALPALQSEALTLCDIGAGAGFPSLPLKIMFPQLKVTIVDSLNKRINFLQDLISKLDLDNVSLVHARAEDFSKPASAYRESFDVVTARAVARLSVLAEYCLPATKVGGTFLAYKAAAADDELTAGQTALKKLGGQYQRTFTLTLPGDGTEAEERNLLVIKKVNHTAKAYPRRAGIPAKKPL